jgi:1-deoxy-D-xylulose-5-phosphate reductoisomerase
MSDFPRLELALLKHLTFELPDLEKFECLRLAVIKLGTYPVVLNGRQGRVDLFLNDRIRFSDIPHLISSALAKHSGTGSGLKILLKLINGPGSLFMILPRYRRGF